MQESSLSFWSKISRSKSVRWTSLFQNGIAVTGLESQGTVLHPSHSTTLQASRLRMAVSQRLASAVLLLACGLLLALPMAAQSTRRPRRESNANRQARIARTIEETYSHRWEIAGGGGYLRFRSGEFLPKNSEITFWMNGTYFLSEKLGITGEIRGGYGNAKIGNNPYNVDYNPQISEYPFMAGPTYRFRLREKYAVSGFALGGTAIGKFDGDLKGHTPQQVGLWPTTNARPAFSLGANLDYNFYPNFAFRIAPSYLGTTFGGMVQNNLGFEMGLIYRFGKQK